MRHFPTLELCLCCSGWLPWPGDSQPLLSKGVFSALKGILIMCYCGDAQRTFMIDHCPLNHGLRGWKKTPLKPRHTAAQWERVSMISQRKNPGFSSTLKQEGRRLCFIFIPACSWNRSGANSVLIAAWANIESFLRSHLICPNDSCSVNNLAKWCLGTLPCSPSLCD